MLHYNAVVHDNSCALLTCSTSCTGPCRTLVQAASTTDVRTKVSDALRRQVLHLSQLFYIAAATLRKIDGAMVHADHLLPGRLRTGPVDALCQQ